MNWSYPLFKCRTTSHLLFSAQIPSFHSTTWYNGLVFWICGRRGHGWVLICGFGQKKCAQSVWRAYCLRAQRFPLTKWLEKSATASSFQSLKNSFTWLTLLYVMQESFARAVTKVSFHNCCALCLEICFLLVCLYFFASVMLCLLFTKSIKYTCRYR